MKRRGIGLAVCLSLAAFSLSAQGLKSSEPVSPSPLGVNVDPSASGGLPSDTIKLRRLFSSDSTSGRFSRLLNDAFTSRRDPAAERERMKQENDYYDQFKGLTIREIHIARSDIFDRDSLNWVQRTANNLHTLTREKVIRRDLLFSPGDTIDPDMMMNNRRLIRSRDYIADVTMLLLPVEEDSTRVDVYVITRDKWSISVEFTTRSSGQAYLELYDKNIFGWGNKFSFGTSFDWKHSFEYGGNAAEYEMPNIFGSFFSARAVAGKDFDRSEYGLQLDKEFLRPTDYAVGVSFIRKGEEIRDYAEDTIHKTVWATADVWAGLSRKFKTHHSSLYLSGRLSYLNYLERPDVSPTLNPYFHDETLLLTEVGLYRERFRTTNRLYGYGINEYVAYGFKMGLNSGFSWGEFGHRWYLGLNLSGGKFTRIGYFGASAGLGSYLNHHNGEFYRSTLNAELTYFSDLKGRGLYPVRQFVRIGVVRGWKRLEGYQEVVGFTSDMQLRAMRLRAFGQNRLLLNSETVVFTPWHIYGFRFAMFGFFDMGLIGDHGNIFRNDFYSSLGLGVRIKNEHLVFNTITLRFGVALGKNGLVDSQYFRISNKEQVHMRRFIPQKPVQVGFQ